ELESTQTTLARVQRIVFGSPTETTAAVLGEEKAAESPPADAQTSPTAAAGATNPAAAASEARPGTPDTASADSETQPRREKQKRPGHGRNGAEDYPRAPHIAVAHATLKHGDPCPEPGCEGRLYIQRREPAVLVRVTGVAPLAAQVYELERLRCGLCGSVFTAEPPAGVGESKYDETAAAMIALLKYGCGLPFHRIQRLEKALAIPLPAATQWEVVQQAAARLTPAFAELAEQAAEGTVLYKGSGAQWNGKPS
ncbi:MAG TPA: hypothetical protein PK752_17630, partial [Accumulibacter sp.]|nr:hypothetical protein [Accumulibacter sp.]